MSCDEWPTAVTFHARTGALELVWDAGVALLSGACLRSACRCSGCESARRRGLPPGPCDGVLLTGVDILGSAGLHCVFSDGHERGIYPWPYLRALTSTIDKGMSHERLL